MTQLMWDENNLHFVENEVIALNRLYNNFKRIIIRWHHEEFYHISYIFVTLTNVLVTQDADMFYLDYARSISLRRLVGAWRLRQFERVSGSSRFWRSLSRLPRFPNALKLLKNRQATQAREVLERWS